MKITGGDFDGYELISSNWNKRGQLYSKTITDEYSEDFGKKHYILISGTELVDHWISDK